MQRWVFGNDTYLSLHQTRKLSFMHMNELLLKEVG